MRSLAKIFLSISTSILLLVGDAYSANEFMVVTKQTSQPVGHYEFCQRHVALCKIRNSDLEAVKLDIKMWNKLQNINASVNKRISPTTDHELYGKDEYWAYPTDAGDCEDYVLEKQLELSKKGFPLSTLLITVVRKPDGEGHAVLTVRTDHGDYVLDNLRDKILLWKDTEYEYLKRQSIEFTGRWIGIEARDNMIVSSVKPQE